MTVFVPYDGSPLSRAAVVRGAQLGSVQDHPVRVFTLVPRNRHYAVEKGWLGADEPFDPEAVADGLAAEVADLAPSAEFEHAVVPAGAVSGNLSSRLREAAIDHGTTTVVLGSGNLGKVVPGVGSVASGRVSTGQYDVYVVRRPVE